MSNVRLCGAICRSLQSWNVEVMSRIDFSRQVSRRWREAVDLEISKVQPLHLPKHFTDRFPNLNRVDLTSLSSPPLPLDMYRILLRLPGLNDLCIPREVFSFLEDPGPPHDQPTQVKPKLPILQNFPLLPILALNHSKWEECLCHLSQAMRKVKGTESCIRCNGLAESNPLKAEISVCDSG